MNRANAKSFPLWSLAIFALVAIVALLTGCDSYQAKQQNSVPTLTSLSPATAVAGSAAFTLTVNGTGFLSGSVVDWNGSVRTTTYASTTQLTASISAADISTAGTATVTCANPSPGGGSSSPVNFTITSANNPSPTVSSLSPTSVTAAGVAFTLTVNGTNYISSSTVKWNGNARTTTFVSATQITAAITAADIASVGTAQISVTNPSPGGGTSPATVFDINAASNPVPTLTNLSPTNANAGSGAITLTVNGTNFISTSAVQWNGTAQPTAFINSTQVTAQISAANLTTAGTVNVTVKNPTPGGGTSNGATFTINAAAQNVGVVQNITQPVSGTGPNGSLGSASINTDGQFVAFSDTATNLTSTDTNGNQYDVFDRETCRGASAPSPCTPSTFIASLTNAGAQGPSGESIPNFSRNITGDGRFVVFTGVSQDFISNPAANNSGVIVLRDTCKGQSSGCTPSTSVVGLDDTGAVVLNANYGVISSNGRTVTFVSGNANVVSGVPGGNVEIYARDTCFGAPVSPACTPKTVLVSASTTGTPAGAPSIGLDTGEASISNDGRYVVFASDAKNLVSNDTANEANVYLRDTCIGASAGCTPSLTLVSVSTTGGIPTTTGNGSYVPTISGNGRYVVFHSDASNLVSQSNNGVFQIYIRDTCNGVASGCTPQTTLVSTDASGIALTAATTLGAEALISANGRYVVFSAGAPMRPGGYVGEVYAIDTCIGVTSGCTPSVQGISFDSLGNRVSGAFPVAIGDDAHYALLIDGSSQNLYLALTGY